MWQGMEVDEHGVGRCMWSEMEVNEYGGGEKVYEVGWGWMSMGWKKGVCGGVEVDKHGVGRGCMRHGRGG